MSDKVLSYWYLISGPDLADIIASVLILPDCDHRDRALRRLYPILENDADDLVEMERQQSLAGL